MGKRRKNRKNRNKGNNVTQATVNTTTVATTTTTALTKPTYSYKYTPATEVNYNYKGVKNCTEFPEFVNLCRMSQKGLKILLEMKLTSLGYEDVISGDGYIYAKGELPILLTAHLDTVHKELVRDTYEYYDAEKDRHIISSPQGIGGDDRCGVFMILQLIKTHKCSVLFCEDEEIGGIGSEKFCKTEFINELADLKYLIELDRANKKDAVFYDCDNPEFTEFITSNTGYTEEWGTFSDISNLSPACKIASVNFSCGYYNAHKTTEYVVVEEMLDTIEVVKKLLDVECTQFEYIETEYYYGNWKKAYGYTTNTKTTSSITSNTWDDDDDESWKKWINGYTDTKEEEKSLVLHVYFDTEDRLMTYVANGKTQEEAYFNFFYANPDMCYNDIYDEEWYDTKIKPDGWYEW